jgi:DNA-binding HxlR family transcriptional regulator
MNLLKDRNPKEFNQLLSKIGHSHNTLRLHLDQLARARRVSEIFY